MQPRHGPHRKHCSSIAVQLFLSDGMSYSIVAYAAIGTDCIKHHSSLLVYWPLSSNGRLLWLQNSCFERICHIIFRLFQEERSIFWDVIISVILSKNCICTCVLFRTFSEIMLFHCTVSKLFDKKEILRTVSNVGIYCSCVKVGTLYLG
jgi:hypothetical protein